MEEMNSPAGEVIRAWLRPFGAIQGLHPKQLIANLQDVNIRLHVHSAVHPPGGIGIVLAEAVTRQVCDFLTEISRKSDVQVLVLVGDPSALAEGGAWRLLEAGANDVQAWNSLPNAREAVAARLRRWQEVNSLMESPRVRDHLIGQSRTWQNVLRGLVEMARFTDGPILLEGETGTGKELVAHLIHDLDCCRSQGQLVILDCTTIVPELSGSELFGHEKGAFTGAVSMREGAFAQAGGGTLFLDEVGELPLNLQVQLLRVVQEHTYKRVGSNLWRNTDFRLVCATNRSMRLEEAEGRFRSDLYYRIASWPFRLPALRDRVEDILPLARHFIRQAHPDGAELDLDDHVSQYLLARQYPGNVRDLRNLVFRMVTRHAGPGPLTVGDIPAGERPGMGGPELRPELNFELAVQRALAQGAGLRQLVDTVKETAIRLAVDNEAGNLQRAARRLGVTDRTLQVWRAARPVEKI